MSENTTKRERKPSKHDRNKPPRWRSVPVLVSATLVACVYLFVTAPPPLAATAATRDDALPVRTVFAMLQAENQAARALWTEEIVARGKAVGLSFDEHWRDPGVQAGPLPAQFLRETAQDLERSSFQLGLFLGSPYPINPANKFSGDQEQRFAAMQPDGAPQFFFDASTKRYTAMFADRAVSEACVQCHDTHPASPKRDWKLHDMMGATTWIYPEATVSRKRALEMIGQLRASIGASYARYLQKVATFTNRPAIGDGWPRDGFYLPSTDVFMRELVRRSSPVTLSSLLDPSTAVAAAETTAAPIVSVQAAPVDPPAPATAAPRPAPPRPAPPPAAAALDTLAPATHYPTLEIRAARSAKVTSERAGRKS